MKQFLRLGDSYALIKHKLKQFKIQYTSLFAVAMFIRTGLFSMASWNLRIKACVLLCAGFMCAEARAQAPDSQSGPAANGRLAIPEGGIVIGDKLPEAFWDLELKVVNHPRGNNTIRLRNYRQKLLVLDFWANYCKPCVESLEKWEALQPQFTSEVKVLPIHIYYPSERALPFAQEKGWKLPIVAGNAVDTIINRLFFVQNKFGQVWIKDGRLIAIPKHEMANRSVITRILTNRPVDIDMDDFLTYFDKRYRIDEDDETTNEHK